MNSPRHVPRASDRLDFLPGSHPALSFYDAESYALRLHESFLNGLNWNSVERLARGLESEMTHEQGCHGAVNCAIKTETMLRNNNKINL